MRSILIKIFSILYIITLTNRNSMNIIRRITLYLSFNFIGKITEILITIIILIILVIFINNRRRRSPYFILRLYICIRTGNLKFYFWFWLLYRVFKLLIRWRSRSRRINCIYRFRSGNWLILLLILLLYSLRKLLLVVYFLVVILIGKIVFCFRNSLFSRHLVFI